MKHFIGLIALLFPLTSQAESLGECYQSVEAMHQAMEEHPVDKQDEETIEAMLNSAVSLCEAEKIDEAIAALKRVNVEYDEALSRKKGDVAKGEVWQLLRVLFGNHFHRHADVNWQRAELNCDDRLDYVATHMNLDSPEGVFFEIVAAVKTKEKKMQYAHVSLPFDSSQYGLCNQKSVTVSLEEEEGCAQKIRVDDGMCDHILLAWPKGAKAEEVTLQMFRN